MGIKGHEETFRGKKCVQHCNFGDNFTHLWICLEKAMAPHSSTLAWKIPWTQEPGRLQSVGSQKDGHDRATNTFTFRTESEHLYTCRSWLLPGF